MKNFLVITLAFAMLVSCKKDRHKDLRLPDNILYHKFDPDLSARSVRYFQYVTPYCGDVPVPSDSLTSLQVDLNNDSTVDFKFIINHEGLPDWPGSAHCPHLHFNIAIFSENDKVWLSVTGTSGTPVMLHDTINGVISGNCIWETTCLLRSQYVWVLAGFETDFTDSYIGIKIYNNYGWIHIRPSSLNGIEISEFAINRTENNSIRAGQKF